MDLDLWHKLYLKYINVVNIVGHQMESLKAQTEQNYVMHLKKIELASKMFMLGRRYILEVSELYLQLMEFCIKANVLNANLKYPLLSCEDKNSILAASNREENIAIIYEKFENSLTEVMKEIQRQFPSVDLNNLDQAYVEITSTFNQVSHEQNVAQFLKQAAVESEEAFYASYPPLPNTTGPYTCQEMQNYAFAAMKRQVHFMELHDKTLRIPNGLHKDTVGVLTGFFNELATKLFKAQEQYGLTDGWSVVPEHIDKEELGKGRFFVNEDQCRESLISHLEKGDILDSVAYLMYLRVLAKNKMMKPMKIIPDRQPKRKPHIDKAEAFVNEINYLSKDLLAKLNPLGAEGNIFIRVFDHYENRTEVVNGVTVVYTTDSISKLAVRGHTTLGIFHAKNFIDFEAECRTMCMNALATCKAVGLPTMYVVE